MKSELSLRDEILQISHRWPIIFSFCLIGILIGWGVSLFWPTTHRVSKEIYVGINPYQALTDRNASEHAGVQFNNPDDYKNWQMANLNVLIQTDWMIDETLSNLQNHDDYWKRASREDLARMLKVNWRNAGKWRLVAESDDPSRAAQALVVWHDTVIKNIRNAVGEAQNTLVLDTQLQSFSSDQTKAISRLAELIQLRETAATHLETASAWPEDYQPGQDEHWELWYTVAQADLDPAWEPLLEAFPIDGSPASSYIEWLNQTTVVLDQDIRTLQAQIETLQVQIDETSVRYKDASNKSFGLSGNLQVEKIRRRPPEQYAIRPTGLLILVGGILGLLLWIILWLVRITLKANP
ncbi:hypothetical protein ACFLV7_10160 [Chloroflexota bacterium]